MKDNELITRRNIEFALLNKGQHSRRYKLGDIWELNYDEIREVLDGVDADADVQPVRWIPVTERLPENSQFVLMTIRRMDEHYNHEPFISVGYISWNQSAWWCAHDGDCKSNDVRVDAWMPLPEPYREEGEHDGNQH